MKQEATNAAANPDVHFLDEPDGANDGQAAAKVSSHRKAVQSSQHARQQTPVDARISEQRSWKNVAKTVFGVAIVLSAGFLAYTSLNHLPGNSEKSAAETAPPVVTVTTAKAAVRPVDEMLSVTGTISSWDELKVSCEVSGLHVKSVNVEEGDRVHKGQVLAELNAGLLEAQLAQAEARLKSALASLSKTVQPNRPEDIAGLKAALEQAESSVLQEKAHMGQAKVNLESAELNVPRYEGLAKLGAVSTVEAETKRFNRDTAKLELDSAEQKVTAAHRAVEQAKHRYLMATRGGRAEDVMMTKASIDEIRAQIKHLSEQIKQTRIIAHDDGLILQRNVHIGDTSDASKPFFVMSRQNRLELRAHVNDVDLPKFHPGQEVSISTNEHDFGKAIAKVRLVSPQVDAVSRLGMVRIDLPADAGLKPGMFVRGEIKLSHHEGLTVPANCVVSRGGESYVFTVDGNRAVSTTVTPGTQTKEYVEIISGLKEGQAVIDKGARFLSDRDVVDVARQ